MFLPICSEIGDVECAIDDLRSGGKVYYLDLCFHIHAADPTLRWLELVDGGSVDWARRLLGNAKERLFVSGIGSERLCSDFQGRA